TTRPGTRPRACSPDWPWAWPGCGWRGSRPAPARSTTPAMPGWRRCWCCWWRRGWRWPRGRPGTGRPKGGLRRCRGHGWPRRRACGDSAACCWAIRWPSCWACDAGCGSSGCCARAPSGHAGPERRQRTRGGSAAVMRIDGGRSEAGADADAHRPRVEAHVAGHGFAGPARVGIAVEVARVGAREPGRGDVHVHAHGADRTLGRGQADVGPVRGGDVLVADVGVVVAQADERAEGLVRVAEVVLRTER